jgi:NAD dependent epimerase/dehydratase family enzyme
MFGEMAGMLLEGQRVLPKAAESAGYKFLYPELGPALRASL